MFELYTFCASNYSDVVIGVIENVNRMIHRLDEQIV